MAYVSESMLVEVDVVVAGEKGDVNVADHLRQAGLAVSIRTDDDEHNVHPRKSTDGC